MAHSVIKESWQILDVSPERALIAAMLHTAVVDARNKSQHRGSIERCEKARTWLRNKPAVMWWLSLIGLPDWVYDKLLKEAGLKE